MKINNKVCAILCGMVALLLLVVGGIKSSTKLTYLEYATVNSVDDNFMALMADKDELSQEFYMPYERLQSIAVKVGTFEKDNNSSWEFSVQEADSGNVIYQGEFNASLMENNSYNNIELDHIVKVDKGEKYRFTITAKDVDASSSLAFFCSEGSQVDDVEMTYNGTGVDSDLCFRIYGGDKDIWWLGFIIVLACFLLLVAARFIYNEIKNKEFQQDFLLQGMLVAITFFLLMFSFSVASDFCDELDNMYGGMVISKGGVLYRDYVTQHTPVTYYLCGVFALLGAGSVEQFRLSFYFLEAIVWGMLYVRHAKYFGKTKMVLLMVLEAICIPSVVSIGGWQVLSDVLQGFCMVILLLEYLRYCQDKKLDWVRSVILSLCVWGSFGAAFISAYALIWVVLIVLVIEILDWRKRGFTIKGAFVRYYKLLISMIVPLVVSIVYFGVNGALEDAFEQAYKFNREVYPKYTGGMGDNLAQPFVNAIQNFFKIISDDVGTVLTAKATDEVILQLVVLILAVAILIILLEKKKIAEVIMMVAVMVFSATRGYNFHGMAAWYVAIMIIALNYDVLVERVPKVSKPALGVVSILLLTPYVVAVGNNLLHEQSSVSEIESEVIALTDDENNDIFLDVWSSGSVYYFYKDRYPVNRAVFMLPWYMDWYEKDNIEALNDSKPKVVVYYEDEEAWGQVHYSMAFANDLKKNYTRVSEDGWGYNVWVRNE